MEIKEAARFSGPNIFSPRPLLRYRISGLKQAPKRALGSAERDVLLRVLPDLDSVSAGCAMAEHPPTSDSDFELPLGHAVEHIAIALQNQAGSELRCLREEQTGSISSRAVLTPFEETEVAEAAVALAFELVEGLIAEDEAGYEKIAEVFAPRIEAFLALATRRLLPVQDRAFVRAARERDVPIYRIAGRTLQLGQGCHQSRVSGTKTTRTNVVSNDIAANKDFSRRILGSLGLPIPRYERVHRNKQAGAAAHRIGFPVVVKPNHGNMGQAVSVGMRTPREVSAAYKRAKEIDRSVLIEEFIEGEDYRVLVIDGKYCAASKRTPGHVVGDGIHTIEELVETLNADPRRGSGPRSPWTRLEFDEQADRLLADREMTRSSVPLEGETVYLRRNANTSDGGTAMDVTEDVHPDNREIAVRAAKSVGLDIAGVDFLTTDIRRSMWRSGGVICEINSRPGLRKHMWPANGPARDIMTPIVDMLCPRDSPSRIPVVGILGVDRRSARTAAERLARLLRSSGRRVGLVLNHRVSVSGRKNRSGRMSAPDAARMILLDPEVEVAILEFTVNDVLRDGLGCDVLDVSLIIAEAEAEAESQVSETSEGTALSSKALDAIRVIARTTRTALITDGGPALRTAARAAASDIEVLDATAGDIDLESPTTEVADVEADAEAATSEAIASRHADFLAHQVATQIGLTRRDLRRALRKANPGKRRPQGPGKADRASN